MTKATYRKVYWGLNFPELQESTTVTVGILGSRDAWEEQQLELRAQVSYPEPKIANWEGLMQVLGL